MVPALCAVAESEGRTVGDLLDAICLAYDVAVDMADVWKTAPRGFDHVNLIGFGVVAGVSRLRGLDATVIEQALKIADVSLIASRESRQGHLSMWKGYAAANQSVGAIRAVGLAEAGVEAPPLAFVGSQGFQAVAVDPATRRDAWTRPAAPHDHRILDTHVKPFPLGYLAQAPVQAAVALHARLNGRMIAAVTVNTYRRAIEIMGDPLKWQIDSPETADHSLPYVTLAALLDGTVSTDSMQRARWSQTDVTTLLPRVSVVDDALITAAYPREMAARVEVRFTDGSSETEAVVWPRGHARNPLSDEEVVARARELSAGHDEGSATIDRIVAAAEDVPVSAFWGA